MKKSISNIGKALNKAEQKTINGGELKFPRVSDFCDEVPEISRKECFCLYFSNCR